MTTRLLNILILVLLATACGAKEPSEGLGNCLTREAKLLQCRADELSKHSYNTTYQQEYIKALCERLYNVTNKCYSVSE